MSNKDVENHNFIQIVYNTEALNENKIKIFGELFVSKNKEKCEILYKDKIYKLKEFFDKKDDDNISEDKIKIKLIGINNITDFSYMFYECNGLISFPTYFDISHKSSEQSLELNSPLNHDIKLKSDSEIINNQDSLYEELSSSHLQIPSSISNISNSYSNSNNSISNNIFQGDNLLSLLNTSNITDMSYMFHGCSLLKELPDISKWNTSKVSNMSYIFSGCKSLISIPDISKWKTSNVTYMNGIFSGCKSLESLPDISKWDTSNAVNMSYMFSECNSLMSLPDISK